MRQGVLSLPSEQTGAGVTGIVIFTGRFGSGKTEIALSYARAAASGVRPGDPDARFEARLTTPNPNNSGSWISLIDLDIVTPYFRSREEAAVASMRASGVEVIAPASVGQHLDTPALTPQILGAIQQVGRPIVLDVGGDPQGARALGQYSAAIRQRRYEMYFVVNPYRPFTQTVEELDRSIREIESNARLQVSSLVSNPHLGSGTTAEHITAGHSKIETFARELRLSIAFVCVERRWAESLGLSASDRSHVAHGVFAQPVLILDRHFVMFWE